MQSAQSASASPSPGFNVIGYASGNLGLGVHARSVIDSILARGFPAAVLDLDPGFGRHGFEARHRDLYVASADALPFSINIFVIPAPELGDVAARFASLLSRPGILNAAICPWELPALPEAWHPALQMFDVLAAGSPFTRHSLEFSLPDAKVIDAPLFLPLRSEVTAQRQRFGLASDICYCITSFEPLSSIKRKNVEAVVEAYKAAVAAAPNLNLIVKVNNPTPRGAEHQAVAELRQSIAGIPGVRLITDAFSHVDLLSLFASCDIYISLHRAEGFGIGMYEAMQLGKPVVATGWSGNMAFMDHSSACLTGYRLVPVPVWWGGKAYTSRGYRSPVHWADPKVEDAAKWLVRLAGSSELRQAKGTAALAASAAYQQMAGRAEFLDELQTVHDEKRLLDPASARLARYLPQVLRQQTEYGRREQSTLYRTVRKVWKIFR